MQNMNKDRSQFLHKGAWVFLFLFTATCTLFFFFSLVPGSLWWLPVVAFVAFEYGVLHWLDYHKHGAQNPQQWYISLVMIFASVGSVTIATGLELVRWFAQAGLIHTDLWWMNYGVWAIIAIFPLNLIALVGCELLAPEHKARYLEVAQTTPQPKVLTPAKSIDAPTHDTEGILVPLAQNGHKVKRAGN